MNYRPINFVIQELVPPDVFADRGQAAWELLDGWALVTLQALRNRFGPITVNNWHLGGRFKESGLRSFTTTTGAVYSQHRFGRAFDCKFSNTTPRAVSAYILANAQEFPYLTTLEDVEYTPGWLHFDCRNNADTGIRVVKP